MAQGNRENVKRRSVETCIRISASKVGKHAKTAILPKPLCQPRREYASLQPFTPYFSKYPGYIPHHFFKYMEIRISRPRSLLERSYCDTVPYEV